MNKDQPRAVGKGDCLTSMPRRNPSILIAFDGPFIRQRKPIFPIKDGFELWNLRRFSLGGFIEAVQARIPPVTANVLGNYEVPNGQDRQYGVSPLTYAQASWALMIPVGVNGGAGGGFDEAHFLLSLYSFDRLEPLFFVTDFGVQGVPRRRLASPRAYLADAMTFRRAPFVDFYRLLVSQSQYGAWQLQRASSWQAEDWRLFVAAHLFMRLDRYGRGKEPFVWQREAADLTTILEALLTVEQGEQSEIGYRLRKRMAVVLFRYFPAIERQVKQLYATRSGFVHGSFFMDLAKQSKSGVGGLPTPNFTLLGSGTQYVRWTLVAYLALSKYLSENRPVSGNVSTVLAWVEAALTDPDARRSLDRCVGAAMRHMRPLPAWCKDVVKRGRQ